MAATRERTAAVTVTEGQLPELVAFLQNRSGGARLAAGADRDLVVRCDGDRAGFDRLGYELSARECDLIEGVRA